MSTFEPPKLWEVCLVIVGALIMIACITKMVRDLDDPEKVRQRNIKEERRIGHEDPVR